MLAAIGLGNLSKYIKQINKTFEAIFPKSLAIDSLRDWLAAPMPKRPRCNRRVQQRIGSSFTPSSPHHPGGRHGGLCMSALREQLGGHGTERGAPGKHILPFMILLPVLRLVRSCVHDLVFCLLHLHPFAL